jgi:hypothetical protein
MATMRELDEAAAAAAAQLEKRLRIEQEDAERERAEPGCCRATRRSPKAKIAHGPRHSRPHRRLSRRRSCRWSKTGSARSRPRRANAIDSAVDADITPEPFAAAAIIETPSKIRHQRRPTWAQSYGEQWEPLPDRSYQPGETRTPSWKSQRT